MEVGDIYEAIVEDATHHPVVIMQNSHQDNEERIRAVGLSHDSTLNIAFDKTFVVPPTEANGYTFKCEELPNGRKTSIMPKGFNKKKSYLTRKIGQITPDGVTYINEHIHEYIECDCPIKQYIHNI